MLTPSEKQGWSCPRGVSSPTHHQPGTFGGVVPDHIVADLHRRTESFVGPLASAALTVSPTSRATRIEPQPFRLWLCRRLFLPLPLSSRTCRCGRRLDIYGDYRAACWEEEGSLSSARQRRCAKLEGVWEPPRSSVIWMLGSSMGWMDAEWR